MLSMPVRSLSNKPQKTNHRATPRRRRDGPGKWLTCGVLISLGIFGIQLHGSTSNIPGLRVVSSEEDKSIPSSNQLQSKPSTTTTSTISTATSSSDLSNVIKNTTSDGSSSSFALLKPRLELLHIQKTGGSLLEELALRHNISWGCCHFDFPWRHKTNFQNCPPLRVQKSSWKVHWHWPLQELYRSHGLSPFDGKSIDNDNKKDNRKLNPYDNILDEGYATRPKRYFVVVRNPYDRILSLFHYYRNHPSNKNMHTNDGTIFNEWIQHILTPEGTKKIIGLKYSDKPNICQYQYVYYEYHNKTQPPGNNRDNHDDDVAMTTTAHKMVDHIVQFEYLKEDFDMLARQYDLPFYES